MAIYSMQTLLNAIGLIETIQYLDRFFAIAVNAVLTNPDHRKIKNYTRKIFDHYIRDKRQQSKKEFKNLQFLFIHSIETLSNMPDITDTLSSELYSDPTVI